MATSLPQSHKSSGQQNWWDVWQSVAWKLWIEIISLGMNVWAKERNSSITYHLNLVPDGCLWQILEKHHAGMCTWGSQGSLQFLSLLLIPHNLQTLRRVVPLGHTALDPVPPPTWSEWLADANHGGHVQRGSSRLFGRFSKVSNLTARHHMPLRKKCSHEYISLFGLFLRGYYQSTCCAECWLWDLPFEVKAEDGACSHC